METNQDADVISRVCQDVVQHFKVLLGKNSRQRDLFMSCLIHWFSPLLWSNSHKISTLQQPLAALHERVTKMYKKGKFLEGAICLGVLSCVRVRAGDEKLKESLGSFVKEILSAGFHYLFHFFLTKCVLFVWLHIFVFSLKD